PLRVLGGQPHPGRGAEGEAEDVRPLDGRGLHERGDVGAEQLGGVRALRLAGQAGAAQVHAEAREVLGVLGDLERVTCLVSGQVGDEHQRLTRALHLVVDVDPVRLHRWHLHPPASAATSILGLPYAFSSELPPGRPALSSWPTTRAWAWWTCSGTSCP